MDNGFTNSDSEQTIGHSIKKEDKNRGKKFLIDFSVLVALNRSKPFVFNYLHSATQKWVNGTKF